LYETLKYGTKYHPAPQGTQVSFGHCKILAHERKDFNAALAKNGEALSMFRFAHGNRHPSVASDLNVIGGIHLAMGDFQSVLVKFEEALAIKSSVLPAKHPDLSIRMSNSVLSRHGLRYHKVQKVTNWLRECQTSLKH
jgi:hypothetical protein